jgi:Family of unknown function (DUF5681)
MRFSDDQQSSESDRNYKVGYGRPPKHSRFQPGHSGNQRGKPAGARHPATILKMTLLEKIPVKQNGREIKITKLDVFIAQLINDAMRPEYFSVCLLFKHAGLGLKLEEAIREQDGGISPEVADLIRRALLGEDFETATLSLGGPSGEPSSPFAHVTDQPKVKDSAEGQVQRVGYGNPPIHSRFRKGQSGNSAGRPRVSKDFAAITRRMLLEKVVIVDNGRKLTLSKQDVILKQIVNKALKGNNRFRALLLEYVPSMDLVLRRRPVPPRIAFERIKRSLLSDDS